MKGAVLPSAVFPLNILKVLVDFDAKTMMALIYARVTTSRIMNSGNAEQLTQIQGVKRPQEGSEDFLAVPIQNCAVVGTEFCLVFKVFVLCSDMDAAEEGHPLEGGGVAAGQGEGVWVEMGGVWVKKGTTLMNLFLSNANRLYGIETWLVELRNKISIASS